MSKSLALTLRPRRLSELVGQDKIVASIRKHVSTGGPQVWMFVGESGVGKTTLARIMAISYQCEHQEVWGEPCEGCWKKRTTLYNEINAASISGIDELRPVAENSMRAPLHHKYQIIILDEAQRITPHAQNLLLKPLEEPPPTTIWIICTTDPEKLLAAIKQRTFIYELRGLKFGETEKFLKAAATKIGFKPSLDRLIEQIHQSGVKAPRLQLQALEKFMAGASPEVAVQGGDSEINLYAICKAVVGGKWTDAHPLLQQVEGEDVYRLRALMMAYLKGIINNNTDPRKADRAADSILELREPPLGDKTIGNWLWAVLWKIYRRFQ